jgi:cell wall-associated NlpC family hydrolase
MTGRDALPRHYPVPARRAPRRDGAVAAAITLAVLLGGCASVPRVEVAPASEPLPLRNNETGSPKPLDLRADDVLMHAAGLIGTRYRYGGQSPQTGFDCSGFTSWVFREAVGIQLPRTAREQFAGPGSPVPRNARRAGDLVFFRQSRRGIDHVGIYVGEGRFVHAPSRGGRVRIDTLSLPHWQRTYEGARRLLGAP